MDIVIVTYNSEKWIKRCLDSLLKAKALSSDLKLFFVDNHSSDQTVELLTAYEKKDDFSRFEIIQQEQNQGFGNANNLGASFGKDEIVCFLNVDTEVFEDTFKRLEEIIAESSKEIGAWEFRQLPYEHPKIYDPVTGITSWMSGAAFAVRREIFEKLQGFDKNIFMYAEDVDFSWRLRASDYKIKYCPTVKIMHYSYESIGAVKPAQYVNSLINNLLLRYRFGSFSDVMRGYFQFAIVFFLHRAPYPGAKKQLLQAFAAHFSCISSFNNKSYARAQVGQFLEWDDEITRDNKIQTQKDCEFCPLVSIIVRTCQRAEVLREALISIRNQTYSNIEVIVVEDGEASAEKMIVEEFSDLNIRYYSTGKKAGRSEAGNLALSKAAGEYINFLDDDDIFFADHVETLVQALAQNRKYLAAYAFGFETPVVVESTSPYKYHIKAYNKRYTTAFDEVELCYHNFIPIQCIMFSRRLYEEFGGFDSSLDYLEDWDLWVRYAQRTKYICVEKTTSLYRVPFEQKIQKERQHQLDEALKTVRKKHESYEIPVSAARLAVYGKKRIWEK